MIYFYESAELPQISMAYSVIRRTVWRIADPYHILIFIKSGHCKIKTDGEEYLLEEVIEAAGDKLSETGEVYSKDVIYWIGYIYRYWHYYTEESSKAIFKQAPVETMKRNYLMFHTMAPEVAIEDLKEIYRQKKENCNR